MNIRTVSIVGCGWLGLPLAKHLIASGYSVRGSTTSQDKLPLLKLAQVEPYLLTVGRELTGEGFEPLFQSEILVLDIPFRRQLVDPSEYQRQIKCVMNRCENSSITHIVFTSSTSVYPASFKHAVEDMPFKPDTPRARVLKDTEQMLIDNPSFQTTVIRFAGMYGAQRAIGRLMAGRKGISDGDSPVNLIHLDDCVNIIATIIQKQIYGEIFNACSDGHPTRRELYTRAARHYGWAPPEFNTQSTERMKTVSNAKLKERLPYTFLHPDPSDFDD